jgi:putative membrane protein
MGYPVVMYSLVQILALAVTVGLLARLLPGVHVRSSGAAVVVALVFSVLNFLLGWLLTGMVRALLFVPAVLSLGLLFVLVPFLVNTILLWLTDKLVESFEIRTLRALVLSSVVITLVGAILRSSAAHGLWNASLVGHPGWV